MTDRDGIEALLRAGLSDRAIGQQLSTDPKKAAIIRRALGLPKAKSGVRPAANAEDLVRARTEPLPSGHARWTGHVNNDGVPAVRFGGRQLSAYRIAFRLRTGRDPVGTVRPGCGMPQCVAPAHMDDTPARARNRTAYNALFGGTQ
ncbi:hypothetical protein ACIGBH_27535 [Streptomyces sp. NPDC085929]|uniref:hypothetical protein n=1 Tax=Streptomyces sp. NPDC085929 TaxID=3365739 RepID=UPI0037CD01A1